MTLEVGILKDPLPEPLPEETANLLGLLETYCQLTGADPTECITEALRDWIFCVGYANMESYSNLKMVSPERCNA